MRSQLSGAVKILELAVPAVKILPFVGNAIEGAIETTIGIVNACEDARANSDRCILLAERALAITTAAVQALMGMDSAHLKVLQKQVASLLTLLQETHKLCLYWARMPLWRRLTGSADVQSALEKMTARLDAAIQAFSVAAQLHVMATLYDVQAGGNMVQSLIAKEAVDVRKTMSHELHETRKRSDTVLERVEDIRMHLENGQEYEGDYPVYRPTAFIVRGSIRVTHEGESRVAVDLVENLQTKRVFVRKHYPKRDEMFLMKLDLLRRIGSRAGLESMLGISRGDSESAFYIAHAGRTTIADASSKMTLGEQLMFTLRSATQMVSAVLELKDAFKTSHKSYNHPWYAGLNCVTSSKTTKTYILNFVPMVDEYGQFIFDLEFKSVQDEQHWPESNRSLSCASPTVSCCPWQIRHCDISMSVEAAMSTRQAFTMWCDFKDSSRSPYLAFLRALPHWTDLGAGLVGVCEDGIFRAVSTRDSANGVKRHTHHAQMLHTSEHWTTVYAESFNHHDGFQDDKIQDGSYSLHILPDGRSRYTFSEIPFGKCFFLGNAITTDWDAPWSWLHCNVMKLSHDHSVQPTCVRAVQSLRSYVRTEFPAKDAWPFGDASLYFFEFPFCQDGPAPAAPGYWSLDPDGQSTSSIVDCIFDGEEWNVTHQLEGMNLVMNRAIYMSFFGFDLTEVKLIEGCGAQATCTDSE